MRRRRHFRPLLAALTALPLLLAVACSGGGSGAADAAGDGRGGPVHLTYWSALRGSQQVVDAYNRTHTRIRVDYEQVPSGGQGGYAKLSNAARAGNAPDVATIEYPQLPGFAIDGVARDITPLVGAGLRARLLPQALAQTTFDHRVFAVPQDIEPMVLLYRKDLFARAGITPPRTWAQFARDARTVRARMPRSHLLVLPTDGGMHLAGLAWQAGGRWYDTVGDTWQVRVGDAPTRKVMAYWQNLIDDDLVAAYSGESQRQDAELGDGRLLAKLTGAYDAAGLMTAHPEMKGRWGVAAVPQWDAARPSVGALGGSTYAVTKDSRHPREAMDFIRWLVSDPAALRARLSSGLSSQYPASPQLVPLARKAMDTSYFDGQDIFSLYRREAARISPDWTWGPRMTATLKTIQDGFARAAGGDGTLLDAVRSAQRATLSDLEALGLDARLTGG